MSFFTSLFGDKTKSTDQIEILDVDTFNKLITAENVQLIDVRTGFEYKAGHIQNAVNIDFFDRANFNENFSSFDREKPIYLYCRSGNRSQRAAKKLLQIGFKKIYDLKGGYKAWK
ncbi:rhodanese-like domain-containing protein [Kordia sp. YSTF-M3]|uniref:Rhodanese-like domain-containing protein n=1 Tax=Kordia aestuariivivens TaxID=2759037 RepID=A0ABR7QEL0_9FLAO|nr:rhodanese-like domain-containing protein [Kordia aestuariivivens]MBC8756754.1 rhodanese-like domain-containing protein [Kordia aestuariivivens]